MVEPSDVAFGSEGPPATAPSRRHKLAELIAQQIEEEIVRDALPAGTVVGSETDLLRRYGVSRPVLREAIRLVEHHQLAAPQRGGGLVVRHPSAAGVAEAAAVYFDFARVGVHELYDARRVLEHLVVELLHQRMDERDVERLRSHLSEEVTAEYTLTERPSFHSLVAEQSGNPVASVLLAALVAATDKRTPPSQIHRHAGDHTAKLELRHDHALVVEALIAGDQPNSHRLLDEHLDLLEERVAERDRSWAQADRTLYTDPAAWPIPDDELPARLAERVARSIQRDIAQRGWSEGEVVASEPALLEEYRVSRGVLREAIRILEHHGVVRMRAGRGGGLVVTRPDPDRSSRAMALYLQHLRVRRHDLFQVRTALEVHAVTMAARRSDRATAPRLGDLVGEERPPMAGERHDDAFHRAVASRAGNEVVRYLVNVVIAALDRVPASSEDPGGRPGPERHAALAAAIADGDVALARRRTIIHMEELAGF